MPDLFFEDTTLSVAQRQYAYSDMKDIRITHDTLFSVYSILEFEYQGKKVSIPFPRKHRLSLSRVIQKIKEGKYKRTIHDPYEEVKKLKELLDLDIITLEQFEQKKKELLDL